MASDVPPHFTKDVEAKLVPLTVSVKPGEPAIAEFGLKFEMAGAV